MQPPSSHVRQQILDAARAVFARKGYQGAPTQEIVRLAKVTKPTLYYYFGNKAGLYKAVVDLAQDERFRIMQEAAAKHSTLRGQLVEITRSFFKFSTENRDLSRLFFTTAFAADGEIPKREREESIEKCLRIFDLIHSLIQRGVAAGELQSKFSSEELVVALFSRLSFYAITETLLHGQKWKHPPPERVVQLFYEGAEG